MIQLYPQRIFLKKEDGCQEPVDLSELERKLDQSLVRCGIQESWLVDHLLVALRDYAAVMDREGRSWDDKSLHLTMAQMLMDAGYADVAECFAEQAEIKEKFPDPEGKSAWHAERIETLLRQELQMMPHLQPRLAAKVEEKMEKLAFDRVDDTLILEVARHLLAEWGENERNEETGSATAGAQEWLLTPGFWQTFLPPRVAELVADEIIEIRPFSELLPVVRLRWLLPEQVGRIEERPLTDLGMLPVLAQTARQIAVAVDTLIQHLTRGGRAEYGHPAHLSVVGLNEMLKVEFSDEGNKQRVRHRDEIVSFLSETLHRHMRHRLILTFVPIGS